MKKKKRSHSSNICHRSSSKSHEESTIDLVQSLIECQQITQLIFENRFNEALIKTKEQYVYRFDDQLYSRLFSP